MPVFKRRMPYDEAAEQQPLENQRVQSGRHQPQRLRLAKGKRRRLEQFKAPPPSHDVISTLSDELLIRIFSYLDVRTLVDMSPVSKRFCSLAADFQLWRVHYYHRFVSPPAHHIPIFRPSFSPLSTPQSSQDSSLAGDSTGFIKPPAVPIDPSDPSPRMIETVDWKRHYKLRHNWARGRCAVQEVRVSDHQDPLQRDKQTLIRVAEGFAITADLRNGMRAWDLHSGTTISHINIETHDGLFLEPTTIALDTQNLSDGMIDIILGFEDGTFGIWTLDIKDEKMDLLYRQEKSFVGTLVSVAYSHPYVMTAAESGFVIIYKFATSQATPTDGAPIANPNTTSLSGLKKPESADAEDALAGMDSANNMVLPEPTLLKQLKSHYSRAPLALCISRQSNSITASIAYSFSTVGGWSIGVQDFDIRPSSARDRDVVNSRVAYSLPIETSPTSHHRRPLTAACPYDYDCEQKGPNKLVYSHPYLLATMPDNTMMMHLCVNTADSFKISRGIRLWGHTSAVADADITPRGKAVSISLQGNELRVWELGGHVARPSVQVQPRHQGQASDDETLYERSASSTPVPLDLEDRTSWVGFDKEMIVVLRAGLSGRENMVVYDFT